MEASGRPRACQALICLNTCTVNQKDAHEASFCFWAFYLSVPPGWALDLIVIAAFFMCFAAMPVHPGFFMFFFMLLLAIGWHGMEAEKLDLTFWERVSGETVGVVIAMAAIAFLQWQQNRRIGKGA